MSKRKSATVATVKGKSGCASVNCCAASSKCKKTLELRRLVKSLRRDYNFDHHRPTVVVSRGDYEQLLKLAERCLRHNSVLTVTKHDSRNANEVDKGT